jgi:hypothetical protein
LLLLSFFVLFVDILFIFSVHVTLPESYEKVCEKLFGKLKKPSDLGRRDDKLSTRTLRRWKREFGENMYQSPYWDQSHFEWHPESLPTNWQVSYSQPITKKKTLSLQTM